MNFIVAPLPLHVKFVVVASVTSGPEGQVISIRELPRLIVRTFALLQLNKYVFIL